MKTELKAGDTVKVSMDCVKCNHAMPHELQFVRFSKQNRLVLVKLKCLGCHERAYRTGKQLIDFTETTFTYDTFKKHWTNV